MSWAAGRISAIDPTVAETPLLAQRKVGLWSPHLTFPPSILADSTPIPRVSFCGARGRKNCPPTACSAKRAMLSAFSCLKFHLKFEIAVGFGSAGLPWMPLRGVPVYPEPRGAGIRRSRRGPNLKNQCGATSAQCLIGSLLRRHPEPIVQPPATTFQLRVLCL